MIQTDRLILRQWRTSDLDACAQMNADEDVMRYFPSTLSKEETMAMIERFSRGIEEQGWGFWACELKENHVFIGFIGINDRLIPKPIAPAVEVGWRLLKEYWGKGYATEGAKACLDFAFNQLGIEQIVSFTAEKNFRSRKVMERIGMKYEGEFEHPKLPQGHPLRRHVLYRICRK